MPTLPVSRAPRRLLSLAGSPLAVFGVVLFALLSAGTAPRTIISHAAARPFAIDYLAFDGAGRMVRDGDAGALYDTGAQQRVQSARSGAVDDRGAQYFAFLYPPVVAAAFAPLSGLTAAHGYLALVATLAGALALCGALLAKMTEGQTRGERCIFAACALGSAATCVALFVGQITPLLVLATLGALVAMRSSRPATAGLLLGLLCVKPHIALVALLIALSAGQRRVAAGIVAVTAVVVVVSLFVGGPEGVRGYIDLTRSVAGDPAVLGDSVRSEQNLFGLTATLLGIDHGFAVVVAQMLVGVAALGLVVRAVRATAYAGRELAMYVFAMGALLVIVASPHVQFYDLGFLLFPALFVAHRRSVATDAGLKRKLTGVLVLAFGFIEMAGMLASVGASVSAPVLVAALAGLCAWPRIEAWLSAAASAPGDSAHMATAARQAA